MAERGDGLRAEQLADLQRQLAELMQQPLPHGSRCSTRQGSRPSSRGALAGSAPLALAPIVPDAGSAPCSSRGVDGSHSPRIRAVHAPPAGAQDVACSAAGDEAGEQGGRANGSSGIYGADHEAAAAPPQAPALTAQAKLQQLLEMEMQRETERAALLDRCQHEGDRRRLAQLFELERQSALTQMQLLQRQQ